MVRLRSRARNRGKEPKCVAPTRLRARHPTVSCPWRSAGRRFPSGSVDAAPAEGTPVIERGFWLRVSPNVMANQTPGGAPVRRVVALQATLAPLRHSRSRLLNAVEALPLIKPPTSSCNLALPRKMTMPHRAIRRGSAAPTDCHPAIRLGEVILVELNAQFGGVK